LSAAAWTGCARPERAVPSTAGERDELFAALCSACTRLLVEANTWRSLDTKRSKLRQLGFGLMEGEAHRSAVLAPSVPILLAQWVAAAAVHGLGHLSPVALAEGIRRNLMPLLAEVSVLTVRLSMIGDAGIKEATVRVSDAAGALLEHIDERDGDYRKRADELQAAIGQLRRARDAAAGGRFRRRAGRDAR
jgi:hypothetical protein